MCLPGGKKTARPKAAGYYKARNLVVPAANSSCIVLSTIPVDKPVHIAAHYAKTVYSTYSFLSELGAIILIVEAGELVPHVRGISTPERIAGAGWPSDAVST
jgi:hypothetical protein